MSALAYQPQADSATFTISLVERRCESTVEEPLHAYDVSVTASFEYWSIVWHNSVCPHQAIESHDGTRDLQLTDRTAQPFRSGQFEQRFASHKIESGDLSAAVRRYCSILRKQRHLDRLCRLHSCSMA
jgi:hypothetical protein